MRLYKVDPVLHNHSHVAVAFSIYVCHNMTEIRFTKSARKHRVGRARAVYVVEHAYAVVRQTRPDRSEVVMFLGDDNTGRALEVGAVEASENLLLVIHVMDLREKFRNSYEQGKREV